MTAASSLWMLTSISSTSVPPRSRRSAPEKVRVGRTSGSIGGGPSSVPASIAARLASSSSAVRAVARISQSAKASLPATWSRCQWLSRTVISSTPRSSRARRMKRPRSTETWVS